MKKVDLWLPKPIRIKGYGEIVHIDTTSENDAYIERNPEADEMNDILFLFEIKQDNLYLSVLDDIERLIGWTDVCGFDLYKLNAEFKWRFEKHEGDTDVSGASKQEFEKRRKEFMDEPSWSWEDKYGQISFFAQNYNAWDEMCKRHKGLRESGLNWYCGALYTEFADNADDIYIGTGDEEKEWRL